MAKILLFFDDGSGATMVEYGLMLAFIAMVCFASVGSLGGSILGLFQQVLPGFK